MIELDVVSQIQLDVVSQMSTNPALALKQTNFVVETNDGVKLDCRILEKLLQLSDTKNNHESATQLLPIIIFVHQLGKLGGSACMMTGMANKLTPKGYDCILFNLRGVGSSSGNGTWSCYAEVTDVKAVIDYAVNKWNRYVIRYFQFNIFD